MKTGLVKLVLGAIILMTASSRKKVTIPDVAYKDPANFSDIFEQFWYKVNKNYVFWELAHISFNMGGTLMKPMSKFH